MSDQVQPSGNQRRTKFGAGTFTLLCFIESNEESRRTQERLVRDQQRFQDEQREKQQESRRGIEAARQAFLERTEELRREREATAERVFAQNVLRAIRWELEALGAIYEKGIGGQLHALPEGQFFPIRLALTQEWFTVFSANAVHLGRLDAESSRRIVTIYAILKAVIEEFRINNGYLKEWNELELLVRVAPGDPRVTERHRQLHAWLIAEASKLKGFDQLLKSEVEGFFAILDQRGIK
jgi:hypothetical protein